MTKTDESLQTLIDKGIIGKCEKHGEVVYFDASGECPTCAAKPLPKSLKRKLVVQPVKPPEPDPNEEVDDSITGRIMAFVKNPKNKGTIIILVVGLLGFIWLYMNYPAIMSYFAR